MIDRKKLLADLQSLLRKEIEPDLRKRSDLPEIAAALKAEFDKAKKAKRTAMNYTDWRADTITQIGVAWVLSCVFIRFLEDNRLVDPPRLSGPTKTGETHSALQRARDEYDLHIQSNPEHSFRQYILSVIDDLAKLPGGKEVFGKNNIIHQHRDWLSNDAAKSLYNFWQKIEPTTGDLVHDFTDDADEGQPFDTRFLGDLYQDLSEAARKKYALLQTPDFVEAFILDRTLEPALDEFGLVVSDQLSDVSSQSKTENRQLTTDNYFRMIDPACGSGHFLLGAFDRILDRWQRKEPGTKVDVLVERTLASIHGVDVNPFAVAIARFRLLLAAFRACHVTRLDQPIDFHINVACGDSLYHGKQKQGTLEGIETDESHYFQVEHVDELKRILREGAYHAVVANPPYIVPNDKAANDAYRDLYLSCHRQYSLAVPFMERIFRLAFKVDTSGSSAGFVGQITANSFMKREFGKKLVEEYLPTVQLTYVIDTQLAHIPGHGTATTIILGRNCKPATNQRVRVVAGLRRDDCTPDPPEQGGVWQAIVHQVDQPGSESPYVSVDDVTREYFASHPWSLGGKLAANIQRTMETQRQRLEQFIDLIGYVCITKADEFFAQPTEVFNRARVESQFIREFGIGEEVRDWGFQSAEAVLFPYDDSIAAISLHEATGLARFSWPHRTSLGHRMVFGGKTYFEAQKPWYEYGQIPSERAKVPNSIVFAFVATHNHFIFDHDGVVFKQSAPVIKLPSGAIAKDFASLQSALNSSSAQFWFRLVLFCKGGGGNGRGISAEAYERMLEYDSTKLKQLPVPTNCPAEPAEKLNELAGRLSLNHLRTQMAEWVAGKSDERLAAIISKLASQTKRILSEIIRTQEDLDWEFYNLYGLIEEKLDFKLDSFGINLGERAFEIVMARKMAAGELETTWFERHGSTPITELPEEWPDDYKALVNRRIEVIESNPNIALIEQPEYKRRWNTEPWDSQVERALREWMLLRLESYFDFDGRMKEVVSGEGVVSDQSSVVSGEETDNRELITDNQKLITDNCPLKTIAIYSVAKLADIAFKDAQFKEVAEVYRGRADFDPVKLIDELVADEHVPALPILRYKPAGLDKRVEWENTWRLQRIEDQIHAEVELICRNALTEESAAAITPDQPLDPYKAILNVNKVDFKSLAEFVSGRAQALRSDSDSTTPVGLRPAAKEVEQRLKNGFAKSKLGTLVDLQRLVTHEILGDIPVPPKYTSGDFISTGGAKYWKLRGKLDVPKERWVSLPHCQGEDQTLRIAWAGYDHLQLLQAIAAYFAEVQQLGGSDDPRLVPLLAAMDQQIPWVKQWHNDTDNEYGYALGDFFEDFIATEARNLGLTLEDVRAWEPPKGQRGKGSKGQSGKKVAKAKRGKGSKVQSDEGTDE